MLKVIHVIDAMVPGGAEKLVADLVVRLRGAGVQVGLVSVKDELALAGGLREQGISVWSMGYSGSSCRLRLHRQRLWRAIRRLDRLLLDEKPDIVHGHCYYPDPVVFLPHARWQVLMTLHGEASWWGRLWRPLMIPRTVASRYLTWKRRVHYAAVSASVGRRARRCFAIPPERIRTIRNGIDPDAYPMVPRPGRAAFPTLIQVGNFYPHKGHLVALGAFRRVRERHPDARLVFLGSGPRRALLEVETRRLGIDGAVEFMGWREDVAQQLQAATVFWMPSQREGLGLACLEAMACGLPVVVSNAGGLPEVVEEGQTGHVVPRGSAEQLAARTLEILADPERAEQLGRAARARVQRHFHVSGMVEAYRTAYEDIRGGRW